MNPRRELCSITPFRAPRVRTVSSATDTACATFFGCDDLVFLVFESMKTEWHEWFIQQDAIQMMRVNRAFYYYAVPLVWLNLSSLKPLYKLLQPVCLARARYVRQLNTVY